ncbi:MAG TPA: NTF2-like N-terminal transpeptidase domain-containing protein, partial [Virgibacillus sp.]|nr:NTF2-like N-terminal transpeptidase domain-containing protein [Virgibacillus sp.]
MKKRILLLLTFSLFIMMTIACSEEKVSPNDRFNSYIDHWHKNDFEKMYQMLADEALDVYPTEEFIDRYAKIYEDLDITDLTINFEALNGEEVEAAFEKGETTIPFSVEMESLAGPITFD